MPRLGLGRGLDTIEKQFAPIFGSESRNFTTLDASGSKHYTIPSISLGSNDFSIEFDFSSSDTSQNQTFMSGTLQADDTIGISVNNSGAVQAFAYVGTTLQPIVSFAVGDLIDSKLNTFKLTYVSSSGVVSIFVNNILKDSDTWALDGNQDIANIGRRVTLGNFLSGIIANVKITDAGTLKRFYKIDETWDGPSTVLVDSGSDGSNGTAVNITSSDSETFTKSAKDWLGVELWTNPPDDVGTEWVDDGGDQYTLTGLGGFNVLGMNTGIVNGFSYSTNYNIISLSADMKLLGAATTYTTITGTGVQGAIILTDSTDMRFSRVSGATNCVLKDVSFKRILEGA